MPAPVDATKPGIAQHSRIELPFFAETAVMLRAGGTNALVGAGQAEDEAEVAVKASGRNASRAEATANGRVRGCIVIVTTTTTNEKISRKSEGKCTR